MSPLQHVIDAIAEHAAKVAPAECCGVIVVNPYGRQIYVPCENAASTGLFYMRGTELLRASDHGEPVAIAHSHPYRSPQPSDVDLTACEAIRLPYVIVSWPDVKWTVTHPTGYEAPLVGRQWAEGVHDCFTLARDALRQLAKIDVPDWPREEKWWEIPGRDVIREGFEPLGFVSLPLETRAKLYDVFIMQLGVAVASHCAVLVGDNVILHHVPNRLSSRVVYGGFWRKITRLHLRHKSLA